MISYCSEVIAVPLSGIRCSEVKIQQRGRGQGPLVVYSSTVFVQVSVEERP